MSCIFIWLDIIGNVFIQRKTFLKFLSRFYVFNVFFIFFNVFASILGSVLPPPYAGHTSMGPLLPFAYCKVVWLPLERLRVPPLTVKLLYDDSGHVVHTRVFVTAQFHISAQIEKVTADNGRDVVCGWQHWLLSASQTWIRLAYPRPRPRPRPRLEGPKTKTKTKTETETRGS